MLFNKLLRDRQIGKKLRVTLLILAVFILGRQLPLPGFGQEEAGGLASILEMTSQLAAGEFSRLTLFSLGLGPMMYTNLLLQVFLIMGREHRRDSIRLDRRKRLLMLVIGLFQALIVVWSHYPATNSLKLWQSSFIILVLLAGASVLSWLASMNASYGIGGSIPILLSGLILGQKQKFSDLVMIWKEGEFLVIFAMVLWFLFSLGIILMFDRAEYRIPLHRGAIHNRYAENSYLPFKINLVGAMPIIYAYSLLALPQYFSLFLEGLGWKAGWLGALAGLVSPNQGLGVLFYLVLMFALTYGLAFLNLDLFLLVKQMREQGDVIPYLRPGKMTQEFLENKVRRLAAFNGLVLVFLVGLPMGLGLIQEYLQLLAELVISGILLAGMVLPLLEEVRVMTLKDTYRTLFEEVED